MRLTTLARVASSLSRTRQRLASPASNNHTPPPPPPTTQQAGTHRSSTAVATRPAPRMWPIGTWDDPLPIVSTAHQRVVACTGPSAHSGAVNPHDTVWITVEKDKLCQCPACRQVFKLETRQT